jgi:hypothetical protein
MKLANVRYWHKADIASPETLKALGVSRSSQVFVCAVYLPRVIPGVTLLWFDLSQQADHK